MELLTIVIAILLVKVGEGLWVVLRRNRNEEAAVLFFKASCAARAEGHRDTGSLWNRLRFHLAVQQWISKFSNPFRDGMLFRSEGDKLIKSFLQMERSLDPSLCEHRQAIHDALFKNLEKASAISISLKELHPLIADRIQEIVIRRVIVDLELPEAI